MTISEQRTNGIKPNVRCILICLAISLAWFEGGFEVSSLGGFQASKYPEVDVSALMPLGTHYNL